MNNFAKILRRIREARSPSQNKFAKRLGWDRKTIYEWEYGKADPPGAVKLKQICDALDATPAERAELLAAAKEVRMAHFRALYPDEWETLP